MKYCKTCQVHYDTPIEHCLLCHGDLEHIDNHESNFKFSVLKKKKKISLLKRMINVLLIGSIFVSLFLDYQSGLPLSWSLTVTAASSLTLILILLIFSHSIWSNKLSKILVSTIIGLFFIALTLKDYHWVLDYVLPFVIMGQILILSSVILFNHKKWLDISTNLIVMTFLGLLPGLFILLKLVEIAWPSVASVSYAFITFLGIMILPSKEAREEFKSRFHI